MPTIPPNPDWFVYSGPIVSRFEAVPVLTAGVYGSQVPASYFWCPVIFPVPVAFRSINVFKSFNASVPGATSQASTGSEGWSHQHNVFLFRRQDYSANSTNLVCLATGSVGLSATLGYSSTSQQFGLSWVTDSTGGTSAFTTTSNSGNWSSFATGPKIFPVPFAATTYSAGEYYIAQQGSTTTATSNSNVTLLSVSNYVVAPERVTYGLFGNTVTLISSGPPGIGLGVGTTITSTIGATMPASVIVAQGVNLNLANFSNA